MGGKYKSPYTFEEIDDLLDTAANVKAAVTEARSWSSGDTGTRPGEEADNAKYWASVARENAGGNYATLTEAEGLAAAAKSEAIAVSADKELSNLTDYQKALRNIGGRPSRDIFDNSDFRNPVNQRGVKDTVVKSGGFILDRWTVVYDLGATPKYDSAGFLSLDNTGGTGNLFLTQKIPQEDFGGETGCTISLFCKSGFYFAQIVVGGDRVYMHDSKINAILNIGDGVVSATIGIATGQKEEVIAVKLSTGSIQTQAYQKDGQWHLFEALKYGDTLARCQRYLQVYNELFVGGTTINYGPGYNLYVPLLIPSMRVKPAVTVTVVSKYGTATDNVGVDPKTNSLAINISSSNQSQPTAAAAYISIIISAEL